MKKACFVWTAVCGAVYTAMASHAVAAPPDAGGIYPLEHGIYVAEGGDCKSPANAWLREYDGKGISGAHSHACIATIRDRQGDTYVVDQTCTDAGTGPAPRSRERQQVIVHDAEHFTQISGRDRFDYRYCPVEQLPRDLRNVEH